MIPKAAILEHILQGYKINGVGTILRGARNLPDWATSPSSLPPFLIAAFQEAGDQQAADSLQLFEELSLAIRHLATTSNNPANTTWGNFCETNTCRASDLAEAVRDVCALSKNHSILQSSPPALKLVGVRIDGDLDLSKVDAPFSLRLIGCWIDGALLIDRAKIVTLDLSGSVISKGVSGNYAKLDGALRLRRTAFLAPVDLGGAEVQGTFDASDCVVIPKYLPSDSISFAGDRHSVNLALTIISKEVRLNRARIYGGVNLRDAKIGGSLFWDDAITFSPIATAAKGMFEKVSSLLAGDSEQAQEKRSKFRESYRQSYACKRREELIVDLVGSSLLSPNLLDLDTRRKLEGLEDVDPLQWQSTAPNRSILLKLIQEQATGANCSVRAENCHIGNALSARSSVFVGKTNFKRSEISGRASLNGSWFLKEGLKDLLNDTTFDNQLAPETLSFLAQIRSAITGLVEQDPSDLMDTALDFRDAKIGGTLDIRRDERFPSWQRPNSDEDPHAWRIPLIDLIVRRLCTTGENPVKFIPLFVPKCDDPFSALPRLAESRRDYNLLCTEEAKRLILTLNALLEEIYDRIDVDFAAYSLKKDEFESTMDDPMRSIQIALMEKPKARLPERAVSALAQHSHRIETVFKENGTLRSTIFSGEIALSGVRIGGSLRAQYAIINVACSSDVSYGLLMQNAHIASDVDFRGSVGFHAISAQQIQIGGSLKLSNRARDNNRLGRSDPLRGRALLPFNHSSEVFTATSQHRFQGATIKGDAIMLFDYKRGPRLCINDAAIHGRLTIYPALGGLELSTDEYEELHQNHEHQWKPRLLGGLVSQTIVLTLSVLIWLVPKLFTRFLKPPRLDRQRNASHWLKLQRRRFNSSKLSEPVYPFQPFLQASKVLTPDVFGLRTK
jgi:hypothetical protein